MAHAALVDSFNVVREIHVISNNDLDNDGHFPQSEPSLQAFQSRLGLDAPGCQWLQCSYSGSFRGCFPSAGWSYDPIDDVFRGPTAGPLS